MLSRQCWMEREVEKVMNIYRRVLRTYLVFQWRVLKLLNWVIFPEALKCFLQLRRKNYILKYALMNVAKSFSFTLPFHIFLISFLVGTLFFGCFTLRNGKDMCPSSDFMDPYTTEIQRRSPKMYPGIFSKAFVSQI